MRTLWLLPVLLATGSAFADESRVKLKEAPGRELVQASCVMCHSLDYIPMNSVFLDRKGWEGSVAKMIKVFGAPIADENVPRIVDYLVQSYGKKEGAVADKPATPAAPQDAKTGGR